MFKSNYQSYDFYFTVFGIPTNVAGTFGGFIQELCIEPPDADNGPNQIYLSSLLLSKFYFYINKKNFFLCNKFNL